jgi:hypothetical protein
MMLFTISKIAVDPCVAPNVIEQYHLLDNQRGGIYGTWHSRRINNNPYPWFSSTLDQVQQAAGHLETAQWWFNCAALGDENRWHSHNPYKWAGVLYIQMPPLAGAIEFKRKAEFHTQIPEVGDFLLFSGGLAHRVHKNLSQDYRITAAFNFVEKSTNAS